GAAPAPPPFSDGGVAEPVYESGWDRWVNASDDGEEYVVAQRRDQDALYYPSTHIAAHEPEWSVGVDEDVVATSESRYHCSDSGGAREEWGGTRGSSCVKGGLYYGSEESGKDGFWFGSKRVGDGSGGTGSVGVSDWGSGDGGVWENEMRRSGVSDLEGGEGETEEVVLEDRYYGHQHRSVREGTETSEDFFARLDPRKWRYDAALEVNAGGGGASGWRSDGGDEGVENGESNGVSEGVYFAVELQGNEFVRVDEEESRMAPVAKSRYFA
ncbi:hypothetical protein HDU98_004432, partial [Podochytrium sp. JEL0797]